MNELSIANVKEVSMKKLIALNFALILFGPILSAEPYELVSGGKHYLVEDYYPKPFINSVSAIGLDRTEKGYPVFYKYTGNDITKYLQSLPFNYAPVGDYLYSIYETPGLGYARFFEGEYDGAVATLPKSAEALRIRVEKSQKP